MHLDEQNGGDNSVYCYCHNYVPYVEEQHHIVEETPEIVETGPAFCYCNNYVDELAVKVVEEVKICNSSSSSSCDEEEIRGDAQVLFFQERKSISRYRMSLKNNGNCRIACKVVSLFGDLIKEIIGEPCILDPGEEWELDEDDSRSIYFKRHSRKYFIYYIATRPSEKMAQKALRNDDHNKSYQIEIND